MWAPTAFPSKGHLWRRTGSGRFPLYAVKTTGYTTQDIGLPFLIFGCHYLLQPMVPHSASKCSLSRPPPPPSRRIIRRNDFKFCRQITSGAKFNCEHWAIDSYGSIPQLEFSGKIEHRYWRALQWLDLCIALSRVVKDRQVEYSELEKTLSDNPSGPRVEALPISTGKDAPYEVALRS